MELFQNQLMLFNKDEPELYVEIIEEEPLKVIPGDLDNVTEMLPQLFPEQQEDVTFAEKRFASGGKGYLFTNGTGTGKAQPLHSKVLTPNGWKTMGDINKNDYVINHEGLKTKVIETYPQGILKVYEITFSDGSKTQCCEEHLWETQTLKERRNQNNIDNSIFNSSKTKDPNRHKPKVRTTKEIMNSLNDRHFIPIVKPIVMNKKSLKIHPYLLGVLLGDGSISRNTISFSSIDEEIVNKCKKIIPKNCILREVKTNENKVNTYSITSKKRISIWNGETAITQKSDIAEYLSDYKLLGTKSDNKFIPEEYKFSSIEQRIELIRGLMDTDGTVDKKGLASYSTISEKLKDDFIYIIQSLGGIATVSSRIPFYKKDGKKIYGKKCYTIRINVNSFNPFFLYRKHSMYLPSYKYTGKRVITNVSYIGDYECKCISVEDKRSLYVTDDCILTHNTFVALGLVYRFMLQGKDNIIIVVPTEQKCKDFIEEAEIHFSMNIRMLNGIHDAGFKIVITTYANYYQNLALLRRSPDLVVYDECHYLNQNEKGKETVYYEQHKAICNLPSRARDKVAELMQFEKPSYDGTTNYYQLNEIWENKFQNFVEMLVNKTKVLFFSATPFAYHKSIKYADGCLFDIEEQIKLKEEVYGRYNEALGFNDFLVKHFGYRMKYNKITIPETGVDVNLMERMFFENHNKLGVMSTRVLKLDYDYSREFITINSEIGTFINSGIEMFYDSNFQKEFPYLASKFHKKYTYNYVNQLLECVKAQEIYERIQQHIDLNRKIVIFHNYNHSALEHPFRFESSKLLTIDEKSLEKTLEDEIKKFYEEYPEYYNLDLNNLKNVRQCIVSNFKSAVEFNGTIPKKIRSRNIEKFNDDHSDVNIILVQIKAGREGISLHDTTGRRQRVLLNLGLPTAPTEAIQTEGRIYRQKLKSNAIYEYTTLQTNIERIAFGTKISQRSRTAENLAMGNFARDLETAFKEGYLSSHTFPPGLHQGTGGVASDKFQHHISEFDKAISYYYSRQKRVKANNKPDMVDYFSTPEPLGMKMVEWLNPLENEKGMEPSAGHGAIARFFPGNTINHFIEPSMELYSELTINSIGEHKKGHFENHSRINKYDFVAMNPPFGISGQTAMEHLRKVLLFHSANHRFRCLCIVPSGPAMGARIESFFSSEEGKTFKIFTEIRLPSCTFNRAGTSVACKLLYIKKISNYYNLPDTVKIDLSYIQNPNEFFERIKEMKI